MAFPPTTSTSQKPVWEAAWDIKHARWYYQDRITGKSSWDKPPGVKFDLPTEPRGGQSDTGEPRPEPEKCPAGWEPGWDPTHRKWYYFNRQTEERKWTFKPKQPKTDSARVEVQPPVSSSSGTGAVNRLPVQDPVKASNPFNREPSPRRHQRESSPGRGRQGQQMPVRSAEWNHEDFLRRLTEAKATGDVKQIKRVLVDVSENNYLLRDTWRPLPRTVTYTQADCSRAMQQLRGSGREPKVTFSSETTADAIRSFASRGAVVCALNFANGVHVGGGYKNGAIAQEEDLCRRMPTLYTSLFNAKREGQYPFGPSTCRSVSQPEKYHNVLYTPGVVLARSGEETGFMLLPPEEQVMCSLMTAAAPNLTGGEVFDKELLYKTVKSIFIMPAAFDRKVNTLILGAWGCGVFGCDPRQICELFARAIKTDRLGELYDVIHFAIPTFAARGQQTRPAADANTETFMATLKQSGIKVVQTN